MEHYKIVLPADLNDYGSLFGGTLLKWIDEIAYIRVSLDFPGQHFVTIGLDNVEFRHPIRKGQILRFHCEKTRVGNTSVTTTSRSMVLGMTLSPKRCCLKIILHLSVLMNRGIKLLSGMWNKFASFSALALIAANSIPLVGVLFYGWNTTLILALFWIENLIVGGFNLFKMLAIAMRDKSFGDLFTCGFFILHYGLFLLSARFDIVGSSGVGELNAKAYFPAVDSGFLQVFTDGVVVLMRFIEQFGAIILLGIAALVLSHLISFIENFLLRGEIFKSKVKSLMGKPYPRVFILHVGIILGALALEKLGSPIWLLAVVVMFKVVVDLSMFLNRHKEPDHSASH